MGIKIERARRRKAGNGITIHFLIFPNWLAKLLLKVAYASVYQLQFHTLASALKAWVG